MSVRNDLALLYAFCRVVDDCVDSNIRCEGGQTDAHRALDRIASGLNQDGQRPKLLADFQDLAHRRSIPLVYARQLIQGVRSDIGDVSMDTEAHLLRYAYRVASTVGLMMCRVMDVAKAGDPFAVDLGIAMQLTNIARDVREDDANRRVYIPESWLDRATLRAAMDRGDRDAIRETTSCVERLLALADRYYESAERGMRYLPARVRPGIRSASVNYRAIGTVIRRDPAAALFSRASTSSASKVAGAAVSILHAAADAVPIRTSFHDDRLHDALGSLLTPAGAA
jgi:phytoene synthase